MITVRAADGSEFEVTWIAISNIDGALRFCVINPVANRLFNVFTNPEYCSIIERVIDGEVNATFEGYTVFRGLQMNYDDTAIVALSKI